MGGCWIGPLEEGGSQRRRGCSETGDAGGEGVGEGQRNRRILTSCLESAEAQGVGGSPEISGPLRSVVSWRSDLGEVEQEERVRPPQEAVEVEGEELPHPLEAGRQREVLLIWARLMIVSYWTAAWGEGVETWG